MYIITHSFTLIKPWSYNGLQYFSSRLTSGSSLVQLTSYIQSIQWNGIMTSKCMCLPATFLLKGCSLLQARTCFHLLCVTSYMNWKQSSGPKMSPELLLPFALPINPFIRWSVCSLGDHSLPIRGSSGRNQSVKHKREQISNSQHLSSDLDTVTTT